MKKTVYILQAIFLICFCLSVSILLFQLAGKNNPLIKLDRKSPAMERPESFVASLSRLSSVEKIATYCDSLYKAHYGDRQSNFESQYAEIVSEVVRLRFYHGYSNYGFENNYLAYLVSLVTKSGYSSIILNDDILKHPNGSCSQQSLIAMELMQRKGIATREVGFQGKKFGGHFCFEAYYNNTWHFFDTNMEPDLAELRDVGRPGIAELVKNPQTLLSLYRQYPKEKVMDIFLNYKYGAVNKYPAPIGALFQRVTYFLSYTIWIFFLIGFIFTRRWYLRLSRTQYVRNSRIHFPSLFRRAAAPHH
ncbi:MAG: hypothetical protein JST23_05125 [Bacteroidetes bacterium]|nr:hypothetical protein [Bacteroidota bacterium]